MEKRLSEIEKRCVAKIVGISGDVHLRRRLYELGFVEGEKVKILSVSPLKNSFLVSVKNYCLALRKNILNNVVVIES